MCKFDKKFYQIFEAKYFIRDLSVTFRCNSCKTQHMSTVDFLALILSDSCSPCFLVFRSI